ncbi:MAG TPA: hypothetical protein VFI54_00010 [Solirubrobacteraceae bacterium]|nr:hypothetical protein [Solirubrobacteraceae bacterium]
MRKHVRRAQSDVGKREGSSTNERAELDRLRSENFELRRANTILQEASALSRRSSITLQEEVAQTALANIEERASVKRRCGGSRTTASGTADRIGIAARDLGGAPLV